MTLPPFYPVLDTGVLAGKDLRPEVAAEAVLEAGAGILQLRHKGHFSRDDFAAADRVAHLAREAGALFVVNDRADIALLLDAALHLGQDDMPVSDARRLVGPSRPIGFSTHCEQQLQAAATEPADYLAIGPIFGTTSKHNPDPTLGLEELARLRPLTQRPLVAIGGITQDSAPSVIAAGADSVAVIAGLIPERCDKHTLRIRTEEWLHLLRT